MPFDGRPTGGLSRRNMKILSLDTAMAACSVAVVDTNDVSPLAEAFLPMERGHAEALPPMVERVLAASGLSLSGIDRIAVTVGPGTFTGVRIGLSFARGLALAGGIPVIGIDSLSAIAANERRPVPLLVVSDARNEEVYAALFDAARRPLRAPHVTSVKEVARELPAGTLIIGTARQAVAEAAGGHNAQSAAGDLPVASAFAALSAAQTPGEPPPPLYLRAPDAKPQVAGLRKFGPLHIISAGLASADLFARLHAEAFEEGWNAAAFMELLEMPGAVAALAIDGDEPLGFVLTRSAADEAEIITIATRPHVQRRGVARQLLNWQLPVLASQGVRQLFLEVAASNLAAQALYGALGFRESGRRRKYYRRRDGHEDAIVLRKELVP